MPDLWLLTYSFAAAAVCASAACIVVLLPLHAKPPDAASVPHFRVLCSFLVGGLAGLSVQGAIPAVPPVTGLDRWLLIGLPWLLIADVAGSFLRRWQPARYLRSSAALIVAPVILHGSVHLEAAPALRVLSELTVGGLLTVTIAACVMLVMTTLADRPRHHSANLVPMLHAGLAVLTLQVAAATVMLGGWIRGGAAALPVAGSCIGLLTAAGVSRRPLVAALVYRWSIWSLCGVVLLGHFFGRLGLVQSTLLLSAAAIPELVPLPQKPGTNATHTFAACLLTLLLLALVLIPAICTFMDRMSPLLAAEQTTAHS
ncbi:MAG: hypothetical protein ACKO2P_18185 [Planctomycetota bacterium]